MSEFRPDLDTRTCSVCGDPVAPSLKGYTGSIRACAWHLAEWRKSTERRAAIEAAWARNEAMGTVPFEAWAAERRGSMQAREEA